MTDTSDWVPATCAPSLLPAAAGTLLRQASTAATRPTVTAMMTAVSPVRSGGSAENAAAWVAITTTTAATPNGPAEPSRITASARSGGP